MFYEVEAGVPLRRRSSKHELIGFRCRHLANHKKTGKESRVVPKALLSTHPLSSPRLQALYIVKLMANGNKKTRFWGRRDGTNRISPLKLCLGL